MAKNSPNKGPDILEQQVVAQSRLFTVEALHLEFSNGEQRHYERMRGGSRGAVMVVPVTANDELVLVREYCAGTHNYQLGFPKGLIDPGEEPVEAANRELKEEVGLGAHHFELIKEVTLAPSYFNANMHILFAKDLYEERLEGDEPEPLEVVKWPIEQWKELLAQSDFTEARSVAALLLFINGVE